MISLQQILSTKLSKIIVGLALLSGLLLRINAAVEERSIPSAKDDYEYDRMAMQLVEGKGYRNARGELTAYRSPGYPVFLAGVYRLVGHDYQRARLTQAVLSTLTFALIGWWAFVIFGRTAATVAVLLSAGYPAFYASYFGCAALITETFYTFLLTVALATLFAYLRSPSLELAFTSGIFWGLAILTRGVPLPLVFILPLILFLCRYPLSEITRYAVITWALVVILLAPWTIRNYRVFKTFVPLATNAGENFYQSNNPDSDGLGGDFFRAVVVSEEARLRRMGMSEPERSKYFFNKGWEFIHTQPRKAFPLFIRKMVLYMDPINTVYEGEKKRRELNWGFLFVLFGSFAAFIRGLRYENFRQPVLLLTFLFLYFLFFHAFFHSGHRYRFPTEPILMVMASWVLASFRIKRHELSLIKGR